MASCQHLPLKFLTERGFLLRSLKEIFPKDKVNMQNFISESSQHRSQLLFCILLVTVICFLFHNTNCFDEKSEQEGDKKGSLLSYRKSTFTYRDKNSI